MSQPVINVSNLTKFYGDFKALDSVSFSVSKGWVYGYLGPNGAGKTTTILGAVLAHGLFGPQESLQIAPLIYLVLIYSNLLFFSLAFMFSEVFRRTTLSLLAGIGIFVASSSIGTYLSIMYPEASKWLPNWSVSNLPSFVASELITAPGTVPSGDIQLAAAIIAVYTVVSILIATLRLVRSDVTKKGA